MYIHNDVPQLERLAKHTARQERKAVILDGILLCAFSLSMWYLLHFHF